MSKKSDEEDSGRFSFLLNSSQSFYIVLHCSFFGRTLTARKITRKYRKNEGNENCLKNGKKNNVLFKNTTKKELKNE